MGNCAGYCVGENQGDKRPMTVEPKDGEYGNNVAYINVQKQEVEIEYSQPGQRAG